MSKNISIAEGGVARQFTNDKIKVNLVGGGTEYYVPESGVQLTTKSVTQNGTYKASDVGKYGFSQFSVNVPGGNGSAGSDGKPTGTVPPGGEGSAVVGEDEDGNEAVIGVDEDGKLVRTPLPSSIVLVTPPTKTSYNDGESIDLSGAVVVAKNADGTTWTDVDHPNGHVSCSCEPTSADASQVESEQYTDGDGINAAVFTMDTYTDQYDGSPYVRSVQPLGEYSGGYDGMSYCMTPNAADTVLLTRYNGYVYAALLTSSDSSTSFGFVYKSGYAGSFYYYGNYYNTINKESFVWTVSSYGNHENVPESTKDPSGVAVASLTPTAATQTITLNWARPGDGKVLSTTMEISVSGSSSTTTGSTGTEGSRGGGTF